MLFHPNFYRSSEVGSSIAIAAIQPCSVLRLPKRKRELTTRGWKSISQRGVALIGTFRFKSKKKVPCFLITFEQKSA